MPSRTGVAPGLADGPPRCADGAGAAEPLAAALAPAAVDAAGFALAAADAAGLALALAAGLAGAEAFAAGA